MASASAPSPSIPCFRAKFLPIVSADSSPGLSWLMGHPVSAPSRPPPDSMMAFWNRPGERGDDTSACTEAPPADSPKMVTFFGSPPNAAMFRCTHLRASSLIRVRVVALELFRMFTAQPGEGEEAETSNTVVEGNQNDAVLGELHSRRSWIGAAAEQEGAAVDPHHHRQLCVRFGCRRPPDIEIQAVLGRVGRQSHGAATEPPLRTIRAELARIPFSLPRSQGLGLTPADIADRRLRQRESP